MGNGRKLEEGAHDALLATHGAYWSLLQHHPSINNSNPLDEGINSLSSSMVSHPLTVPLDSPDSFCDSQSSTANLVRRFPHDLHEYPLYPNHVASSPELKTLIPNQKDSLNPDHDESICATETYVSRLTCLKGFLGYVMEQSRWIFLGSLASILL